jgi:DNA-binding CsgD family transcriptional regulator
MTTVVQCCCTREHLTGREVATVELVAAGLSNDQIGRRLNLSPHTVASYIMTAMRRLGAHNRAELVARCFVAGILDGSAWPPVGTGHRCVGPGDAVRLIAPALRVPAPRQAGHRG